MSNIEYISGGRELLDLVKPLWEQSRKYHEGKSNYFASHFVGLTFDKRKEKFFKETTELVHIDITKNSLNGAFIGYCICSVSTSRVGEIDSLFLETESRKLGIGEELMNRAIAWLDDNQVTSKVVVVGEGNENVLEFYERFGFRTREIVMEEIR